MKQLCGSNHFDGFKGCSMWRVLLGYDQNFKDGRSNVKGEIGPFSPLWFYFKKSSRLSICNFIKRKGSATDVLRWVLQSFTEQLFQGRIQDLVKRQRWGFFEKTVNESKLLMYKMYDRVLKTPMFSVEKL